MVVFWHWNQPPRGPSIARGDLVVICQREPCDIVDGLATERVKRSQGVHVELELDGRILQRGTRRPAHARVLVEERLGHRRA